MRLLPFAAAAEQAYLILPGRRMAPHLQPPGAEIEQVISGESGSPGQ